MKTFQMWSVVTALAFAAAVSAQTPETRPNPMPSTSDTEGTAADRTPPGKTATDTATDPAANPQPSTSPTEGTAADRTPPGKTPTAATGRDMVGTAVVSKDEAPLGTVVEVVFDAQGQPEFVVIATEEGESAAVPYRTASSMRTGNKVVMDKSRLERAPTVKQGEWQGRSGTWKEDASRYWNKG